MKEIVSASEGAISRAPIYEVILISAGASHSVALLCKKLYYLFCVFLVSAHCVYVLLII